MPFFMSQWIYHDKEVRALLDHPQDRVKIVAAAMEAFGGRLHEFYFAFGDYDGIAISEFPDGETALSCFMTFAGDGGLKSFKTTVLLTPEEARRAIDNARHVVSNYSRPSGVPLILNAICRAISSKSCFSKSKPFLNLAFLINASNSIFLSPFAVLSSNCAFLALVTRINSWSSNHLAVFLTKPSKLAASFCLFQERFK